MLINSNFRFIFEKDIIVKIGFYIVVGLAVLGMALQLIRGFDGMEASWAISIGMEVLALFVSAVIYYGFLQIKENAKVIRTIFAALLVTSAFCIFWDEVAWLVQSIPRFSVINRISNSLLYINSYTITLMFWGYLVYFFNIRSKLAEITTRILVICWVPASIFALLNIFFPIYFFVDSTGTYQHTALYPLNMLYYMLATPIASVGIIRAKVTIIEKLSAFSFYVFPILGVIVSIYMFGISTSAICTMIPIGLNYCVVISNREKKYSITQNGLDIATKIQRGMLPRSEGAFPDRKDFSISASMTPAQTVGGDFYDFFMLDDTHLAILIADVSDKGIPAALFMTISKVFMKTCIEMGGTPSEIIAYADEHIADENDAGMFVTLWLGIIDLETGHVEACNAGHDYPAISSASEGYKVEKTPIGPPIAFLPGMQFPEVSFDLEPGDSIFLYTDGLVEAKRKDGARFGVDRMLEVLNSGTAGRSADTENTKKMTDTETKISAAGDHLIDNMKKAVAAFVQEEPQFDDMTMLSFTYFGNK